MLELSITFNKYVAMKACRVHITGASGAGTTSLSRALAQSWSVPCHDTDDFYWQPVEPAFSQKRSEAERLELMQRLFLPRKAWILSGSLMGWGDILKPHFDAVVFLQLDPAIRLKRLRDREIKRFGRDALEKGGTRNAQHEAFMRWAAGYDDPAFAGRSLANHEAWFDDLDCRILRLDSALPVDQLVSRILAA
ncbi:MAG: hypothetical protein AAF724_06605 [Pseudomonadota bacterium]